MGLLLRHGSLTAFGSTRGRWLAPSAMGLLASIGSLRRLGSTDLRLARCGSGSAAEAHWLALLACMGPGSLPHDAGSLASPLGLLASLWLASVHYPRARSSWATHAWLAPAFWVYFAPLARSTRLGLLQTPGSLLDGESGSAYSLSGLARWLASSWVYFRVGSLAGAYGSARPALARCARPWVYLVRSGSLRLALLGSALVSRLRPGCAAATRASPDRTTRSPATPRGSATPARNRRGSS